MSSEITEHVRRAWASGAGVDLRDLLSRVADDELRAEVVLADAECRAARALDASLAWYRQLLRWPDPCSRVARELLAMEVAATPRGSAPSEDELIARYGDAFAGDIRLVMALAGCVLHKEPPGDDRDRLKSGDLLEAYRLQRPLGRGSFGEVWLAWDGELERHVALKVMRASTDASDPAGDVLREARAVAGVVHPNVVGVRAAGRAGTRGQWLYIDMELCADPAPTDADPRAVAIGASLIGWAKAAARSPREVAQIMSAICDGVIAAHAQGVVHCDLKPANVLVTPSGRPMVADFGLASRAARTADLSSPAGDANSGSSVRVRIADNVTIRGTPSYMSPEQARGEPARPISDVYGLGAVMYWLLEGRDPYRSAPDESLASLLRRVGDERASEPRIEAECPITLARICARAMRKRPTDRYASAEAMKADLDAWLAHRVPPVVGASSPWQPLALWLRRNAVLAAVASAAMLGMASATIVAVRQAVDAREQRDAAVEATDRMGRTLAFIEEDMLGGGLASDGTSTIEQLLQSAHEKVKMRFSGDVLVQDRLSLALGTSWLRIGNPSKARELLGSAGGERVGSLDARQSFRLEAQLAEAELRLRADDPDTLADGLATLVTKAEQQVGRDDDVMLGLLRSRAMALRDSKRYEEAISVYARVLEVCRERFGSDDVDTLIARHNIELVELRRARELQGEQRVVSMRAAKARRDALTADTARSLGSDHPQTLASEAEGAGLSAELMFYEGALVDGPDARQLLDAHSALVERCRIVLGPVHWRTLETEARLVWTLRKLNLHGEALRRMEALVPLYLSVRRLSSGDTQKLLRWYAESARVVGQPEWACRLIDHAIEHDRMRADRLMLSESELTNLRSDLCRPAE